jgi:glycosyltransferase involved in cell wall biosynthesis
MRRAKSRRPAKVRKSVSRRPEICVVMEAIERLWSKDPEMNTTMEDSGHISVALCTCDGEKYVRAQIESILGQSQKIHEIVVGDDASCDGTQRILAEYQARLPGLFRVHRHAQRLGTIKNLEFVLSRCTGEIIFLSDQDDVWKPQKVATMLKKFRDPRCLLVFTDGNLIDALGKPLGSTLWREWGFSLPRRLRWQLRPKAALYDLINNNNKVTGATVALRSGLLRDCLPIRLPRHYWHDAWLAMHAAARDGLAFLPHRLIDYRIHSSQQVGLVSGSPSKGSARSDEVSAEEFRTTLSNLYPDHSEIIADTTYWTRRFTVGHLLKSEAFRKKAMGRES